MADHPKKGRCAGCEKEYTSLKAARAHVAICSAYAEIYHSQAERALDPGDEWLRVQAEKADEELRAERKSAIRSRLSVESDRKLSVAAERWKSAGRFSAQRSAGVAVPTPLSVPPPVVSTGYGPATTSFLATLNEVVDSTT